MANLCPAVTFQVNLTTQNLYGFLSPNQYQSDKDLGRAYDGQEPAESAALDNPYSDGSDNRFAMSRVTYFPGLKDGSNRELHHGDRFTLYGAEAQYYVNEINKGNFSFLSVVSQA